jgi:acylphosphatase
MATDARVPTSHRPDTSGWSIETAIDHLLSVVNEKDAHVRTLIDGNDKRYEERFLASQKALELGLAGTKTEIGAALVSADRAVQKAEVATEKRFESVNEFRGTLDNQQRTLIPRSEVEVIKAGIEEKIAQLTKTLDEVRQSDARGGGAAAGGKAVKDESRANLALAISVVLFLLTIGALFVKNQSAAAPPPPQVIYAPAPAGALLPTTPPSPVPR